MAGPAKPPTPEPVAVTTPTGKTGFLPPQFADAAARTGARGATDTEIRTEQLKANQEATADALRRQFEDESILTNIEGQLAPQAAGLGRGMSLGLSDEAILKAAELLSGPEGREAVRQRMLDYKAYAPGQSAFGEVGGMIAGTVAGEGILGAGPGAVSKLGAAAESAVGHGLAGTVARGAAEGAAFGAGDTISESALHNHDLTAEALIGGAAHGALGGAVAAGVIGGAGKALSGLRAPKAAAFEGLATRTYGEAAPGVGRALAEEVNAGARRPSLVSLDASALDAGLREAPPAAGRPFEFGREIFPHGEGPSPGRVSLSSPDAGLYGRLGEASVADRPIRLTPNAPSWLGPESMQTPSVMEMMQSQGLKKAETALPPALSPNGEFPAWYGAFSPKKGPAGLALDGSLDALPIRGELPSPIRIARPDPGLKISEGTLLPREVLLRTESDLARVEARSPISIPAPVEEGVAGGGRGIPQHDLALGDGPYRTAERGAADSLASKYIEHLPGATPAKQAEYAEAWANRERVFQKHGETIETASREVSQAIDEALAAGRKVDMSSFGEAKVHQMERLVDKARFGEQAALARGWLDEANGVVARFAEDPTAGMTSGARKQWVAWNGKVATAIEQGDSVALHTTLDNMKRFVGQQAQFGRGPFGLSTAAREFDSIYQGENGIKGLLESDVWGEKAAAAQRNINGATHMMLSEGKLFTRKFTTEFGSDAGRPLYTADTSAVSGFMNRLTSAANDLDARGFESWVQARRHYLNALERSYTFEVGVAGEIAKERAALEKLDNVYRTTTKDVALSNQTRAALQEERERGMGGAIGAVLDVANKPYTTLQRLAQIEAHTKNVLDKLSGGTREFLGVSAKAADEVPKLKPASTGKGFFTSLLDGLGMAAGKSSAAAGAMGSRELFRKRAEEIGLLQGHPAAVTDRVTKSLGPISSAAPNVVTAASGVALRGLDFLAGKLPPSRVDPYSLQPQLQPATRASDAEISQFMRFSQAIDDPLVVLREAKSGTLTRDHVEAVKAVYPQLYEEMRGEVMRTLVDSKSQLPYGKRIQLGILLDLPTDKTLAPDFLREIQATYSGAEKAGAESPPPIAPPELASSAQTATQMAVERAQ